MKMKVKGKRKSQFALETLLLLAGFFAFLGILIGFGNEKLAESIAVAKEFSGETKLSDACLLIGFFALDGQNALLESNNFQGFKSKGNSLFFGNYSANCPQEFRFEGELKIGTRKRLAR